MKNRPVIINTSRGEVMDERALLNALGKNLIHRAGIDVYENEPTTQAQSSQNIMNLKVKPSPPLPHHA